MNKLLERKIEKKEVISFDIFDTLIKRNCKNPVDIFEIVEKKFNKKNENRIKDFKEKRINAEKIARVNTSKKEINIEDIYENLVGYEKDEIQRLKDIEIETEYEYCVRNNSMYEVYEFCKQKNKKIICISDMYLSTDIIKNILKNAGYDISNVFVSSEMNAQKRSGELFEEVIKKLSINRKKVLHIGDSKRSDFINPRLHRIDSFLIKRNVNNTKFLKEKELQNFNNSIIYSFINNNEPKSESEYFKIGYEILGPIAFGFCKWLNKITKSQNIDKLFFCARDMKFMYEIYDRVNENNNQKKEYLYISRKSTKLPFLYKNNSYEDFLSVITDKKMQMKDILLNVGISDENILTVMNSYNLNENTYYNNNLLKDNKDFERYYNEIIKNKIQEVSKTQYDYFNSYLNEINFKNNIALIDLGWKGTIQYSLQKTLENVNITGFYFGIEKDAFKEINENNSYKFIFGPNSENGYEEKIYSFRSLFELLFSALHGTTLKYSGDISKPYILANPENKNNQYVKKIQFGAECFIKDFSANDIVDEVEINELIEVFIGIGIKPTLNETKIFGEFNFDNMISGKLAKPDKMYKYILNPKKLKKDIFNSEWKVGFLKRLLKIKLPYYNIYNYLRMKGKGR